MLLDSVEPSKNDSIDANCCCVGVRSMLLMELSASFIALNCSSYPDNAVVPSPSAEKLLRRVVKSACYLNQKLEFE